MLSYQHIYHAGCLADVHKHAALCIILAAMTAKPKPMSYVETHAGRGVYDMRLPEAQKTGEAARGFARLGTHKWFAPEHPYMTALASVQLQRGAHIYAGSPALAQHFLRAGDRLHLHELHPQEIQHLQEAMKESSAKIYQRDGYEGFLALAPPTPRRGLVFIDPSFEIKREYETLPDMVAKVMKKWPVAVLCAWYPLLPAGAHVRMVEKLQALDLPKSAVFQAIFAPPDSGGRGMYGSGLFCANLPFGTDEKIADVGQVLHMVDA